MPSRDLPFHTDIRSRFWLGLFVEGGVAMIVAFTIVTSFINNFHSLSSFPNSAKISRVQTVCLQQSSETLSFPQINQRKCPHRLAVVDLIFPQRSATASLPARPLVVKNEYVTSDRFPPAASRVFFVDKSGG